MHTRWLWLPKSQPPFRDLQCIPGPAPTGLGAAGSMVKELAQSLLRIPPPRGRTIKSPNPPQHWLNILPHSKPIGHGRLSCGTKERHWGWGAVYGVITQWHLSEVRMTRLVFITFHVHLATTERVVCRLFLPNMETLLELVGIEPESPGTVHPMQF